MGDVPTYTPERMLVTFDPQTDERSPWVTACEHTFNNGTWNNLTVPAGFRCDLASVPGPMLWLFGPNGRHQRAALFHDAAYRHHKPRRRSTADEAFRSMMLDDGVPPWKAWLMYVAVRLFGRRAWAGQPQRRGWILLLLQLAALAALYCVASYIAQRIL